MSYTLVGLPARLFWYLLLASFFLACERRAEPTLLRLLPPEQTGITFANTITENDSINLLDYEYVYNGGGVAVIDVNIDGLPDLFFSGNMVPSRLYLNEGNLKFSDITEAAGITTSNWATGAAVADVNADGLPDLYVCSAGSFDEEGRSNLLYINNGDNTFTERAEAYGVADKGYSTMAAFLDYDRDRDPDLYVVTYANDTWDTSVIFPKVTDGSGKATDRLYRNNGDGTFTNVSREAGILIEGYGLGVAVSDINRDGWPDIYVSNDYVDDDFIWINNQDGTFTESAAKLLNHISHFAMGNDIADINNDGLADIMVVDMVPEDNERQKLFSMTKNYDKFMMTLKMNYMPAYMRNTLQLNNGDGTYSEIGQFAGIHHTDWSWAPLLADLDNDGNKDLFVTNGYPKDIMNRDFLVFNKYASSFHAVKMPTSLEEQHRYRLKAITELQGSKVVNYVYRNNGDLTFTKKSAAWGVDQPTFSNGAAYADLDGDGDLDLAINNIDDVAHLYENRAEQRGNNFLRIKLEADSVRGPALGATVKLYGGPSGVQFQEHYPYRGFQSTVEPVLHFGLGDVRTVDSVEITWPEGYVSTLRSVAVNQVITVTRAGAVVKRASNTGGRSLFISAAAERGIDYVHRESDFNDFTIQPLLPHKLSQNGPGIAVADVNGDGLSDFYIGGSQHNAGAFYLQSADGSFSRRTFSQNSMREDLGALFFDADGDADADLYVVSGGSEQMAEISYYQDRLYFNDGDGNFTHDPSALPRMFDSGSCVTAADYDRDGDLDLFVGGRVHPGKYPLPGRSYLLRNEGGRFEDVSEEAGGPGFSRMGMVTAALWTDYNNDGQTDLITAGEWMPVTVFENRDGQLTNVTAALNLDGYTGWWNSLAGGDFDNDGDTDYIAGNLGRNSRYRPTFEEPVRMYTKDFDENQSLDPILTYYLQGEEHVVHSRDEIIAQLPYMRKRFPRYADYAKAKFTHIFSADELEGAYQLKATTFNSCLLQNNGVGGFTVKPLPDRAQFAPIYGMVVLDVDADGRVDVLTAGNSFATEISIGRYDASYGALLKGSGAGDFTAVPFDESGFSPGGDCKGMASLVDVNGRPLILVARNAGPMEAFSSAREARQTVKAAPMECSAVITLADGSVMKKEFYYGHGYLSHSERALLVPAGAVSVDIFSYDGTRRSILLQPPDGGASGGTVE